MHEKNLKKNNENFNSRRKSLFPPSIPHTPEPEPKKNFFTHQLTNTMAKKQSKSEVAAPIKKNGDGGRIKKPATKAEQTKTAAKAVVAASQAAGR